MTGVDSVGPAESIAVIGLRGRFPGADSVEQLWENLCNGVESISFFTKEELRAAGIDDSISSIPGYVNAGCVLKDIDLFDAGFFGFSARDAELIDPQQRVFMEAAWESLEAAGYDADTYPGSIGVFAGSDQSTYMYQIYSSVDFSAYGYGGMMSIGNEKDYLTTQTSYKLNLRGPSIAVQSSCSTSLVAVCLACQSLLSYQCDIALSGGVAISVPQRKGYWYQPGAILSSDGHCRPFDADAQGTVVGNGVGIVVLKRLSEALADGDTIHAVIKGVAMNNDGSLKVGYTAPSVQGQAQAITTAQAMAGIDPDTITYVEAHGTATTLGDPVEVAALSQAFRLRTARRQYCALASLKSNMGHLSSAAGVSGLIKTVLMLRHKKIPPSLHFKRPNAQIDFARSPFFVPTALMDWKADRSPRRAGVSSFGVGGTNAHVVLEEAPARAEDPTGRVPQLLVISARTPAALERATDNLVAWLELNPEADLADVAFTLQAGRKAFGHRRVLLCERFNNAGATLALRSRDPQKVLTAAPATTDRPVVFMFSGQGTQYADMGLGLYWAEPTFRAHVDYCSEVLKRHLGFDLRDALFPPADGPEQATERLRRTAVTQPALFTIEYALARLWQEWGVLPRAMIGHSIGEYVAACVAGVMSLDDALALVATRGRLMASMPPGAMIAAPLSEAAVRSVVGQNGVVSLAAVNAPSLCVLSGPSEAIEELGARLAQQGLPCRRLHTSHAFHSAMVEPMLAEFERVASGIAFKPPQIAYVSNVTGTWIRPEEATSPAYWARHLRKTVRFADGIASIAAYQGVVLLELGPGQTLCTLARQQLGTGSGHLVLSSMRSAKEEQSDLALLVNAVGQLWLSGVTVDWRGFHAHEKRRRMPLPTYPFERQRFWIGPLEDASSGATVPAPTSEAAKADVAAWLYTPSWKPAVTSSRRTDSPPSNEWLIFADECGLGEQVASRLAESGRRATLVVTGERFTRLADGAYRIHPGEAEDYDALFRALREGHRSPQRILHLWAVNAGELEPPSIPAFERRQDAGFFSLVFLAQALGRQGAAGNVEIGVVTNHLHAVIGDEPLDPAKATILGPAKVVPQEYPNLRCRNIDISLEDAADGKLAERLIAELTLEPFAAVVAYRKGRRWLQTYEPLPTSKPEAESSRLRQNGVYLLIGGLGNIGLTLAESLARAAKARLVLTGRSVFPEREQWDEWLAKHPGSEVGRKILKLRELEKLGAEVMVRQADATDPAQMAAAVGAAIHRFGAIHGAVHGAAHLAADAFTHVRDTGREQAGAHFRPKAHGLMILEEVLRGQPLDFVFLLSSLSATLGGLGLAAYAASNLFLDAFAAQKNQKDSVAWISVNWDSWDFGGERGGRRPVADAILPAQGQEAFRRILEGATRQAVVSTTPLQARLEKWINLETVREAQKPAAGGSLHPRPNLSTQFVASRNRIEQEIAGVWEHLLGVSPIGVHDKFFELGGHSLLAVQLLSRLREMFQVDIPAQRLFEAPTIAQLAESIERDIQAQQQPSQEPLESDPRLLEMLEVVERLSEDEVRDWLARSGDAIKGGAGDG